MIRAVGPQDAAKLWAILEPVIRGGETYALPQDMTRQEALSYRFSPGRHVFVAEADGEILGTYHLRANQQGGGAHIADCGYMTHPAATGKGVANAMCSHSLEYARTRGFLAMQFNFVVSTMKAPYVCGNATVSRLSAGCREHSSTRASDMWTP